MVALQPFLDFVEELFGNKRLMLSGIPVTALFRVLEDTIIEVVLEHEVDIAEGKVLVFTYTDDKMSFTGDLANELLYRFPEKVIVVGRKKGDELRMSIRSTGILIPPILDKCLIGLEGYGGGHEFACGANVKERDFEEFVERIKKNI